MAWVKIPPENHPLFLAALPRDPRVTTMRMFGAVVAKANGYLFGGLFARSVLVRLSPEDQQVALALDGTAPFDPMGNGRVMRNTLLLPEDVLDDASELRTWLARALAYTLTLPPKLAAGARRAKPGAPKGAASARSAKPGSTKPATTRAAALATKTSSAKRATKPGTAKRAAKSSSAKRGTSKPGTAKRAATKPGSTKPATARAAKPGTAKRAATKRAAKPGTAKRRSAPRR